MKFALTPLNRTAVAPVKLVPLMVTLVPTGPLVGAKLVIVGKFTTVKLVALVAVPPGVMTLTVPVVAPAPKEIPMPLNVGDPAPDFDLFTDDVTNKTKVKLSGLRGKKVVLLFYWATW